VKIFLLVSTTSFMEVPLSAIGLIQTIGLPMRQILSF
jgi:hypothetical protein